MSHPLHSSNAIENPAARAAIARCTRSSRRLIVGTVAVAVVGILIPPSAGLAAWAATATGVASITRTRRLRRLRKALANHPWRHLDLTLVDGTGWWQATANTTRTMYALGSKTPPRIAGSVAGPSRIARRKRQWSAFQADGSDEVRLVKGPRRRDQPSALTFEGWIRKRPREVASRPRALYDVPSTECRLDQAGLTAHTDDGADETMIYVVIWARRAGTCELWLNGGGRIGQVARDAQSFGLLDQDGRLVVDREQRHGNQLFVNASGPLASSHRDTLALPSLELMCRALRNGFALETSNGEIVARVVTIDRKRAQTTALASIKTYLHPIAAGVTLLHLCALLGLPCAPAASS